MKLSKYTVVMENYPKEGHYFCLNTMSKATVVLNKELFDYIESLKGINNIDEVGEEGAELVKELLNLNIICPDTRNEVDYLYYWLNSQRYNTKNLVMTLLTTYRCNLACPYCYEQGIKLTSDMDAKVQQDTYEWIKEKIEKHNPASLKISFLGGEPLVNTEPIDFLSQKLHQLSQEKGFVYKYSIVTNGVLLSPEKVKNWVETGLSSIQVTLDGVKEIHDTMRPFGNGAGSFDIIVERLKKVLQVSPKLRVAIRINCNQDNYKRVPELLDYLSDLNLNKDQIAIGYGHLVPYFDADEIATDNLIESTQTGEVEVYLAKETKKRGFRLSDKTLLGPCMTIRKGAHLIDPLGDLYNCWSFVGRPDLKLGSIYKKELSDLYYEMIGFDLIKDCVDCKYVPICLAGCRNNTLIRSNDLKGKECRSFFKGENGEELLKLYFAPDYIEELAQEEGYEL